MLPINLALISHTQAVALSALTDVAAALQKQIVRDFQPIWNVAASIAAFKRDSVPAGYWPISVERHVNDGLGIHLDDHNMPYALVLQGDSWPLTASHEMLEMLVDPWGSRTIPGPSLEASQGRVDFLVEVCDPCEDDQFAYSINGVPVSDFYTPRYLDPVAGPGVQYSFGGNITAPRQVLANGYLSWFDAERRLFQAQADADGEVTILSPAPAGDAPNGRPLRQWVDGLNPKHQHKLSNAALSRHLLQARDSARLAATAASQRFSAHTDRWRITT